jgi:hypothetical protein
MSARTLRAARRPSSRAGGSAASWLYAAALAPPALILLLAAAQDAVPLGHLTRDAQAVAVETGRVRAVHGALSNVGVVIWVLSAGAALGCAAAVLAAGGARRRAAFLAAGAAIGLALAIDDLFMIHEGGRMEALGGEVLAFAVAAAAAAAYVAVFRREIRESPCPGLLALAFAFFAASLAVDLLGPGAVAPEAVHPAVEDGAKLLGIFAWAGFHAAASVAAATR